MTSTPPPSPIGGAELNGQAPLLGPGVRVSIELPEGGTCVAVVAGADEGLVALSLLDELPAGGPTPGSAVGLFLPRQSGIYHWPCVLRSLTGGEEGPEPEPEPGPGQPAAAGRKGDRAEVQLLSEPVFVQRRLGQRWESALDALVRRVRSARRSAAHTMKVVDLSRGGLKLEGPFPLSTGDTVEVTIDLSPQVQLVGRAVMAYPTTPRNWAAHVSFVGGQREALLVVEGYIARQRQE